MAKTTAKAVEPKAEDTVVETKAAEAVAEDGNVLDAPVGLAEGDNAHELSKAVETHDLKPSVEIDDSKESKAVIKEDEKVKDAIVNGEVVGLSASQMSVAMQPMVAELSSGRPVYATAEQAHLAQAAAGKLGTPSE